MPPHDTPFVPPFPVLLYHSVSDEPPAWIARFAVTPATFAQHVETIQASGATALTVAQYAAGLADPVALPERPVVITFDDGLADFQEHALPALRSASLPVTLFVTTGFIDGLPDPNGVTRPPGRWLDAAALRDLHGQGVELGGHSHSHPQLDTLSRAAARSEASRPKEILEDLIAEPVASFAYPHGYYGPAVRSVVREVGYATACAVRNAFSSRWDDPLSLARLTVRADTSMAELEGWLHGTGAPVAGAREQLRTRGWRLYRRGRALVRRRPGTDWD